MLKTLIDRPVTVTMMLLSILVLGGVALNHLPVSLLPEIDAPFITVQATGTGLSAREMDHQVVAPLRQELMQVGGLENIECEAMDQTATIRLSFPHRTDMDYAFIEVNEKIDHAITSLPSIERPRVYKASASDIPAFFLDITLKDDGDFIQLSRFCEDVISRRIEQLPEVAMVDLSGICNEEILIVPDLVKMTSMGITFDDLENAVRASDIQLGSLSIRDGQYRYPLKFASRVAGVDELSLIWIRCGGRLLQLKDIASVSLHPAPRTGLVRSHGKPAVSLAVIKQGEARMSGLKKGLHSLLEEFQADYPTLSFEVSRDQTRLLDYSIHNLLLNILAGILLASLVIFLFMQDFRSPALVALTMPLSLIFSLLVFYMVGLSLNILSLSGILLGVGMMVDNSIILIDNITSRWQRGEQLRHAVLEGTREVTAPMLSSVLTTCAVFLPLIFVNGIAGALFRDEAIAVTVVLLTSFIVTVTIIPVYYAWWYKNQPSFRSHPLFGRIGLEPQLHRWDTIRMSWWLNHTRTSWVIIAASLVGMGVLFVMMPRERLPEVARTDAIVKVEWNDPVSIEENEARTAEMEDVLKDYAIQLTSQVGVQGYVLGHSGHPGVTETRIYFNCKDAASLEHARQRITGFLADRYPKAVFRTDAASNVLDLVFADDEEPLVSRLHPVGDSEIKLQPLRILLGSIRKTLPEKTVMEAVNTKPEVLFVADLEKMGLYGVSYDQLYNALLLALNDKYLLKISEGDRELPVVMGTAQDGIADLLDNTFVEREDRQIPVSLLMKQSYSEDFKILYSGREGSYYPLSLTLKNRDVLKVRGSIAAAVLSDGAFDVDFSGSWFSNRELAKSMMWVLLVALMLLYLILASQFESLLQPVIILLEVAVDLFVSLLVLCVAGVSLNLMSLIGLVVVTGIVINDSILKIDTINRLKRSGMPVREAVMTASSRRFKAILMTSLTTILAVAPFLRRGSMGADLQYPMSLVIIAGMIVGTMVSLFVVPSLYYSFYGCDRGE